MVPMAIINQLPLRRRAMIACALIPLVAFSGLPAYGCICADGHYEPRCNAIRCAAPDHSDVTSKPASDCCGRSCCAHRSVDGHSHSCCQGHTERDVSSHSSLAQTGAPSITGKSCCTPFVRAATVATVANSMQAVDDHQLPTIDAVTIALADSHIGVRTCPHFLADIGPPPDDLVVTLGRLVI
jgi:hypothetical protein